MINHLKYATIADIGVFDLFYYDEKNEKELVEFCESNNISYLPAKNRKNVYKLIDGAFEERKLLNEQKLNPYDRIFENSTLKKFKAQGHDEVYFIVENHLIRGVVHIVDYNNEYLQVELYRALLRFESNLRRYLVKSGKKNQDFIDWVKEKYSHALLDRNENDIKHWGRRVSEISPEDKKKLNEVNLKMAELSPFQSFYLKELLNFAKELGLFEGVKLHTHEISTLRNKIAHSVDLTSERRTDDGDLVYNFKHLKTYIQHARSFFYAYDYLSDIVKKMN